MNDAALLQIIRKYVNIDEMLKSEPGITESDITDFFQKIQTKMGTDVPKEHTTVREVHLYTDGASRGNPGPAAVACVLKDGNGGILLKSAHCIGTATNNVAEYTALLHGLDLVRRFSPEKVSIYSDSELMVLQMTGVYKTKEKNLITLKRRAQSQLKELHSYSFNIIPRSKNREADLLANGALDER